MRRYLRFVFAALVCLAIVRLPAAPQSKPPNTAKEVRFEVVSIRPVQPGAQPAAQRFVPTTSGFESSINLFQMIMVAYGPVNSALWGSVQLLNAPNWATGFYNLSARVSKEDVQAWQRQSKENELLRSAMRAALKDRFKLALHEQPAKGEIFELVAGRSGPRMKAAARESVLPVGVKLADGGVRTGSVVNNKAVWTWHAATMQDLAEFLSLLTRGIPVRDKTGLTGKYDFTTREVEVSPQDNRVYSYDLGPLGVSLKTGSENRPNLVIDHVEKPVPN